MQDLRSSAGDCFRTSNQTADSESRVFSDKGGGEELDPITS